MESPTITLLANGEQDNWVPCSCLPGSQNVPAGVTLRFPGRFLRTGQESETSPGLGSWCKSPNLQEGVSWPEKVWAPSGHGPTLSTVLPCFALNTL